MSTSQASSHTTHEEQDLSCSILDITNFQNGAQLFDLIGESFILSNINIPKTWVLIDIQSTLHMFYNKGLIINIRVGYATMSVQCNTGISHTNMIRKFPLLQQDDLWFHSSGIDNVILLVRFNQN